MLAKDLINTWEIHNRINLYLLEAIDEAHLSDVLSSKGRNAGEQLAHIHNVRLMWLGVSKPELMKGMTKLEKGSKLTKKILTSELNKSAVAISRLLEEGFETGKIKNFKPHPSAFFGYMIAHESHHRGQIILCLKQSGHKIDQKVQYGIWEWGVR